jgi:predicted regulator of Ras-like GTPase activity (Roadblock/LC7/MglB family)
MSFDSILRDIVDACPGALGAALMGADGIPIEEVAASGAGEGVADEVGVLGVEFGRILEEARKAAHAVDGGSLEELSVRMSRFQVVVRSVDAETYLVLALAPEGNAGKGRFLLRRHCLTVRAAL